MSGDTLRLKIFLCYRQIDGKETASWLYDVLNGLRISKDSSPQQIEVIEVYFDQTAPAVPNWHEIHLPALMQARALIFICSPGAFVKQNSDDWVHKELNWWIKNRRAAPILVDVTGQGERWIPECVTKRWPDAQRVQVELLAWKKLSESERRQQSERITSQIIQGIRLSESRVVDDVLKAKRKEILRLRILIFLLLFAIGWAVWSAYRQRTLVYQMLPYSDSQQLADLNAKAQVLWPADERIAPQMQEWLRHARQLLSHRELHQATLEQLRQSAGIQASVKGPIFPDIRKQWEHDSLTNLVKGLDDLGSSDHRIGTIAEMEARFKFAQTVRQRSIEDHADDWRVAIEAIKQSEIYHGLELKPQVGLIPIGPDPDSKLWEFSHLQTGQIVRRGEDGRLALTENSGLVLVLVPGGTFWMGAQNQDPRKPNFDSKAIENEYPVHQVQLSPFFLSKYEMTQGQWLSLTGENPSLYRPGSKLEDGDFSLLHPVEQVSWEDCSRVLNLIEMQFPTEAQWEYAARGGTSTPWWTGKDRRTLIGVTNLADQAAAKADKTWGQIREQLWLNDQSVVHSPIGQYKANQFGLHDIYGNLWEWCRELQVPYSNSIRPPDGERIIPEGEDRFLRARRGSAFTYGHVQSRSAYRASANSNYRTLTTGVRPAKRIE